MAFLLCKAGPKPPFTSKLKELRQTCRHTVSAPLQHHLPFHTGIHTILSQIQNKMAIINEYPDTQTTLDPTINDVISLNSPFSTHIGSFGNILRNIKPLKTKVFISNL